MNSANLGWLVALLVLGLWMLGAHNRVTALKAAVLAAWTQVDAVEAVAGALAQVQAAADAVRRAPLATDAVADLGKADAVLSAVLVRLVALAEQRPALLGDEAVAAALQGLRNAPPQMAFARQLFNDAGSAYNAATAQFPTRLLGALLRFGQAGRL